MSTKWDILREESTEKIVDAALEEFAEKGYSRATLKNIAQKAGVANGLVSKYFNSKENLLLSLFKIISLDSIFEGHENDTPDDALNHYIDYARNIRITRPALFQFFATVISSPDIPESIPEFWKSEFSNSVIQKAILKAQETGSLPEGDPYDYFRLLFATTYLTLRQYGSIGIEPPENRAILGLIRYTKTGRRPK